MSKKQKEIFKLSSELNKLHDDNLNEHATKEATMDVLNLSDNQYNTYITFLEKQHNDKMALDEQRLKAKYKLIKSLLPLFIVCGLLLINLGLLIFAHIVVTIVFFAVCVVCLLGYGLSRIA